MNKKDEKIKFTPEQERAYTHDDSDLIVAASAGAGKTQVLIEYIFDKVAKSKKQITYAKRYSNRRAAGGRCILSIQIP